MDRRREKKHNISFFGTQLSWILLRVALFSEKYGRYVLKGESTQGWQEKILLPFWF